MILASLKKSRLVRDLFFSDYGIKLLLVLNVSYLTLSQTNSPDLDQTAGSLLF